jgi:hypothetical protein
MVARPGLLLCIEPFGVSAKDLPVAFAGCLTAVGTFSFLSLAALVKSGDLT